MIWLAPQASANFEPTHMYKYADGDIDVEVIVVAQTTNNWCRFLKIKDKYGRTKWADVTSVYEIKYL